MSQPRYAEFIRLRTITEDWIARNSVDGNNMTDGLTFEGADPDGE